MMCVIFSGRSTISRIRSRYCLSEMVRPCAILSESIASTSTCAVKALVDATPISGPACRWIPASVSRAIVEPTVLTIPSTRQPASLAWRSAARVSAVSPDWEMTMTMSSSGRSTTERYLNSEAYSTSTGMRQSDSSMYSPTSAACHDVPHAQKMIRRHFWSFSRTDHFSSPSPMRFSIPPSMIDGSPCTCGSSGAVGEKPKVGEGGCEALIRTRPRMHISSDRGCSWISLSMKCLYPPFSICSSVPSISVTEGDRTSPPLIVETV
mmetsp:Transcript_58035/g.138153  ORF Transcript_58035/g.138153 Transcript_58035/m.138153 type:complete len:265 (-) Transcript_58035:886-1680(-)